MTEPDDHPSETPETAEAPTVQQPPVAPAAQAAPFAGQPYPGGYYAPYPFAPVAKEPWFNPAKRTTILVASVIAALVLLGGGILIGAASSDHHDRERGFSVYGPVPAPGGGIMIGPRFHIVPGQGKHPGRGTGNGFGSGGGPNLAPSSSQSAAPSGSTATS